MRQNNIQVKIITNVGRLWYCLLLVALIKSVYCEMECPEECSIEIHPWFLTSYCNCIDTLGFTVRKRAELTEVMCAGRTNVVYKAGMSQNFNLTLFKTFVFNECPFPNISIVDLLPESKIDELQFINQCLTYPLTADVFKGMNETTILYLRRNKIDNLPEKLLQDMSSLRELDLDGNMLQDIPLKMFMATPKLEVLRLTYNRLRYLNYSIGDLSNLQRLYINSNPLEQVSALLFQHMERLETLDLNNCHLKTLDTNTFDGLLSLETIQLYGNRLTSVSPEIFRCNRKLTEIYLAGNPISEVPSKLVAGLDELKYLWLFECKLSYIPEGFLAGVKKLERIDLRSNGLHNLPVNLFQDVLSMNRIDLSFNNISIFRHNLIALEELYLEGNRIETIQSSDFSSLGALKLLSLKSNGLYNISQDAFNAMWNLTELYLSNNSLTDLPCLPLQLKALTVDNNNLTFISQNLKRLPYLFYLSMNDNKFSNISTSDLQLSSRRVSVSFRNNQIKQVFVDYSPDDNLSTDYSEIEIDLTGNQLACDCRMFPFYQYLKSHTQDRKLILERGTEDKFICATPRNLENKPVLDINEREFTCQVPCPHNCTCLFYGYNQTSVADCSSGDLKDYPQSLDSTIRVFIARNNSLTSLPDFRQPTWRNISYIDLSYNQVELGDEGYEIPTSLHHLSLVGNGISSLPEWFMNSIGNNTKIELRDNL